jgi:hypothetical protein
MATKLPPLVPEHGDIAADLIGFANDPLMWLRYSFEWGEGSLAGFQGPDDWAAEFLEVLGDTLVSNAFNRVDACDPVRMAVGSGHGIGKSALVAWLILFIMSTRPDCRGTVTASTSTQLETRTFPELQKWYTRFIGKDLFRLTTGRGSMKIASIFVEQHPDWFCSFQTCAKENSEAFQGQHAATSTSFFINDESSGVPDEIWVPQRGGLTDGEPMHFAFGNRTRNTGEFHQIWGDQAERWVKWTVDSRDVRITNKRFLQELIDDYGMDSDIVRVRVLGLPPTAATNQFISSLRISEAMGRSVEVGLDEPLILGVDVARHGGDHSVVYARKGRDGVTHGILFKEAYTDNLTHFAEQIAGFIGELGADRVFVDGGGVGGGVVDHLHASGFRDVVREVNFGSKSPDRKYHNRRAYMWGMMRDWLAGGSIPDDHRMVEELTAQEYTINVKTRATQLVTKEHMKAMGLESPDFADALALTFAEVVAPVVANAGVIGWGHQQVFQGPEKTREKFIPLVVR